MICYCGCDLGEATIATKGLCPDCDASIWMQVARRLRPDSVAIAESLNRTGQRNCEHGRNPCLTRCGVRRTGETWEPISLSERENYFALAFNKWRKNDDGQ